MLWLRVGGKTENEMRNVVSHDHSDVVPDSANDGDREINSVNVDSDASKKWHCY